MSEIEDDDGHIVTTGTVLCTPKTEYVLDELLGEGGFGAVYRVHKMSDKSKQFAMKIEKKLAKRRHSKLKMEVFILKLLAAEQNNRGHFTAIVDRGRKAKFYFLVMQLVGKSLEDLHRERPTHCFSLATTLGIGIQALEALEDLHKVGFLHRDIKPANYACGLEDKRRFIYLLDFGIARKYVNADKELKGPRCMVNFKGTIRYASIACHRNQEVGPKDDIESWFYMIIELMTPRGLPWRKLSDRATVLRSKEESRKKRDDFLPKMDLREELSILLDYVDEKCYADALDYDYICQMLRFCAEVERVNLDEPYDWEVGSSSGNPTPESQMSKIDANPPSKATDPQQPFIIKKPLIKIDQQPAADKSQKVDEPDSGSSKRHK